ncbi:multicopper oxidase domain-containing protein [Methylacidiphilum caldifontis]|uniref:multicopper oxidase domain-containing protein n=1 Tax=Methylacidiphilum caldifontis TaxID=2795386 RepID=UPI001A906BDC|nr:multicopper oxidase domain-containing protein [Methylacidiphilum caldifontis]QSR88493.1 multicopper oxidase domain-containing protein [Methylacidiphilum caldifontis]
MYHFVLKNIFRKKKSYLASIVLFFLIQFLNLHGAEVSSSDNIPDISRDPADVPPPIGKRPPKVLKITLHAIEIEGKLAEHTSFRYWTFDGKVPGPFLRARVGDVLEIHLINDSKNLMVHSIDFHAAWGFAGGAAVTQAMPGQEKIFSFKALNPVYHCGTPMVAQHVANGMYGLILI